MTTMTINPAPQTTSLSRGVLAEVLFASPLQESEHPTTAQVRAAVDGQLLACHADVSLCAARVAQEAGDHPETYLARMRWALDEVHEAYGL